MAKRRGKGSGQPADATQPSLFPEGKPSHTEVEAYGFIRKRLADAGWCVRDPSRNTGGQVWTQNQCRGQDGLRPAFGAMRPENVIKLAETSVWIIEAKAKRKELEKAFSEVTDYAKLVNDLTEPLRAVIVSGVAGNESDGYDVRTAVRVGAEWRTVTINGQEATGFLSPNDTAYLLDRGGSDVKDFTPNPRVFLKAAERINGILHNGGIEHNERAKTIAALLLAVLEKSPDIDASLPVLIRDINARSGEVLRSNDKQQFERHVEIIPPTSKQNHVKYRAALIRTITELKNLNIRSAMNSSTDGLGQFYEVFLKYGNGAKEIGIVLTPRHVTRFAVDAVGVTGEQKGTQLV